MQADHEVGLARPGCQIRDIGLHHFNIHMGTLGESQARDGVATICYARRLALDHAHARRPAARR